jgi:hypothetical protein
MKSPVSTIMFIACLALFYGSVSWAGKNVHANNSKKHLNTPQAQVVCTGWHALCDASTDCKVNGDIANCDCWRVSENHIVITTKIQDSVVKNMTQAKCTRKHPCDVDEAPVCRAIKNGRYNVDNVYYDWVSTYSYRGWCETFKPKACYQNVPSYNGDLYWADCMAAPCMETLDPSNPDRPLSCQCRVESTPFVGTNGTCTGDRGGIMSTFSRWEWDFKNNTYRTPPPGYEYVKGACEALKSDPLPQ